MWYALLVQAILGMLAFLVRCAFMRVASSACNGLLCVHSVFKASLPTRVTIWFCAQTAASKPLTCVLASFRSSGISASWASWAPHFTSSRTDDQNHGRCPQAAPQLSNCPHWFSPALSSRRAPLATLSCFRRHSTSLASPLRCLCVTSVALHTVRVEVSSYLVGSHRLAQC